MLGFPLGVLYANAGEWLLHKYVLHELGRDKKGMWSAHWHTHHRNVRMQDFLDSDYARTLLEAWDVRGTEVLGLAALALAHAPLLGVAPGFTVAVWASILAYYAVHQQSHLDADWARAWVPWHYDHHMGPNQDANWCVTLPWFDYVMGTREPYYGTEREYKDSERKRRRKG